MSFSWKDLTCVVHSVYLKDLSPTQFCRVLSSGPLPSCYWKVTQHWRGSSKFYPTSWLTLNRSNIFLPPSPFSILAQPSDSPTFIMPSPSCLHSSLVHNAHFFSPLIISRSFLSSQLLQSPHVPPEKRFKRVPCWLILTCPAGRSPHQTPRPALQNPGGSFPPSAHLKWLSSNFCKCNSFIPFCDKSSTL